MLLILMKREQDRRFSSSFINLRLLLFILLSRRESLPVKEGEKAKDSIAMFQQLGYFPKMEIVPD